MSHQSKYVTETGIDVFKDPKTGIEILIPDQTLTYILSADDTPTGFGKTISPKAVVKMIKDRIFENVETIKSNPENSGKNDAELKQIILQDFTNARISTTFGKESLLRILSQQGCIGIRFTNCKSLSGNSIVAVGITEGEIENTYLPLKKEYYVFPDVHNTNAQRVPLDPLLAPFGEEEGIGDTTATILESMGNKLEEFVDDLKLGSPESIENFSNRITTKFFGLQ